MDRKISKYQQYIISIMSVLVVSLFCFLIRGFLNYQIVALLLFLLVTIFAVLFDIIPVVITAVLSSFILNIFFIEPTFHYKINSSENALLFFIFLAIALISTIFTNRVRKERKIHMEKEGRENTLKLYETLLNSLSHELRIPITTVIGAVDTLKENGSYLSEENKDELLTEIQEAGFRLNVQVDNLLNMSRLETGFVKLKKDWIDLNELVFMCLKNLHDAQNHLIEFLPDENLPLFKIDAGLIQQVIIGLVQNAIKYTPKGSLIEVFAKEENNELVLKITDNGKGFPDDKLDKVFEKFYRLPNSGTGGTGLGLSIVKGFVEIHGGSIKLENNASKGACFTIKIPSETSYLKNLKNE